MATHGATVSINEKVSVSIATHIRRQQEPFQYFLVLQKNKSTNFRMGAVSVEWFAGGSACALSGSGSLARAALAPSLPP